MGTIKDLVDLITQLVNSAEDRKVASELKPIQLLALELQSKQADLHEANIKLRDEGLSLKQRIQEQESEIAQLKSSSPAGPEGVPTCPNCSTNSKPFYMRPIPKDFVRFENATHECSNCGYKE